MVFVILMLLLVVLYQHYVIRNIQEQVNINEEDLQEVIDIVEYKPLAEEKIMRLAHKYNVHMELDSKLQLVKGELTISKKLKIGGEEKFDLTQYSYSYIYAMIDDVVREILEG